MNAVTRHFLHIHTKETRERHTNTRNTYPKAAVITGVSGFPLMSTGNECSDKTLEPPVAINVVLCTDVATARRANVNETPIKVK
jgi:hypothetical protein